jgi:hypothetical protein
MIALHAAADRDYRQTRERQALVYSLAILVGQATHNPKKIPGFTKAFPDPRRKPRHQTPEEMLQAMKAWSEVVETATRH